MSYTTTTITRRFYKLKVKAKPAPGKLKPRENGKDPVVASANRIYIPPLFQRSFALPVPLALRSRWWRNWKWVTLSVVLAAALCGALYYSGKSTMSAERHSPERQQAVAKVAPVISLGINMRPMRLSSSAHSAPADARQTRTDPDSVSPGSRSGREMSSSASDRQERQALAYLPADGGELHTALDGRGKLVLPTDVSGSCNVGDGGVKDLGACLARNGAHAE